MLWLAMLPGVGMAVLGVIGLFADAPMGSAMTAIAFGVFWIAMIFFVIRAQRRSDQLRYAFAQANPEAANQNDMLRRLGWLQWIPFGLGFVWVFATLPFAGNNANLPIYGFIGFLAVWLAVMLYRAFIMANLDAAAFRALKHSFGGQQAPQPTSIQKFGTGAFTVVLIIVILGGVWADEYANLPFKFIPLFWWAMGVVLVGAAAYRIWREVRRRLPKRQE